jgi:ABC-type multidrug transport system fused ATPase/permease subunit
MKAHNPITQLEQLILNADARIFLKETAKWAFFIAILGIFGIAFMFLGAIASFFVFDALPQSSQTQVPFDMGVATSIFYLVMALLYIFPVYYLLQFSTKLKKALNTKNDEVLANAFEMLKSHYKYIGVLFIIIISLNVLTVVAFALGAFAI